MSRRKRRTKDAELLRAGFGDTGYVDNEELTYYKRYVQGRREDFKPKKQWETDVTEEEIEECGAVKEPIVYISTKAVGKISYLMRKMDGMEWACDLIGVKKDGNYYIDDIYIFKQTVTTVNIKREEEPPKGYIGTTHSHHHMGAFFSGTDDSYPNINHNLSGVLANEPNNGLPFTMMFTARVKTPCGKYKRYNDVKVAMYTEEIEVKTDNIKEEHYGINRPFDRKGFSSVYDSNGYYGDW